MHGGKTVMYEQVERLRYLHNRAFIHLAPEQRFCRVIVDSDYNQDIIKKIGL